MPIKTYADNVCFDGYWHFMMLTLSIFVKERVSRILGYVYSNVHERSGLSHTFLGMGPGPMELGKFAAF